MSFQTTNPNKNAYLNNNCLVLINKDTNEDVDMMDYVQKTFNYTVPNNRHKTIIVNNKYIFILNEKYNIFNVCPVIFSGSDTKESILSIVQTISKIITQDMPINLINLINFKLFLYFGDNFELPFGFVKEGLYITDMYQNNFAGNTLRLYIRSFQYTEEGKLTLSYPFNEKVDIKDVLSLYFSNPTSTQPVVYNTVPSSSSSSVPTSFGGSNTTSFGGVSSSSSVPTSFGGSSSSSPSSTPSLPTTFGGTSSTMTSFGGVSSTSSTSSSVPTTFGGSSSSIVPSFGSTSSSLPTTFGDASGRSGPFGGSSSSIVPSFGFKR